MSTNVFGNTQAAKASRSTASKYRRLIAFFDPFPFSLSVVQARALICLNNIVSALDTDLLGGEAALDQLWSSLFTLTFAAKSEC